MPWKIICNIYWFHLCEYRSTTVAFFYFATVIVLCKLAWKLSVYFGFVYLFIIYFSLIQTNDSRIVLVKELFQSAFRDLATNSIYIPRINRKWFWKLVMYWSSSSYFRLDLTKKFSKHVWLFRFFNLNFPILLIIRATEWSSGHLK